MGIIEAVKKGFGIAAKNIGLVLVLFVFNLIWNIASLPFSGQQAANKPEVASIAAILSVVFIILSVFIQSGTLALVRDFIKQGSMKLSGFLGYGLKYYLRLFGLGLLIVLIIGIVGLLAALIVILTAPLNNTVVTVVASLIAIVIGVIGLYYVLLLVMSPYGIVCEELNVIQAMKKSMGVVRRSIGKVLLLLVTLILISLGLGFVIGLLTGLLTIALPAGAGQVIISIANSILNGYLGLVMMASFMSFYIALTEQEKVSAQKVF